MVQNERLAGIFEAFLLCHLKEMLMRLCFFKIQKKKDPSNSAKSTSCVDLQRRYVGITTFETTTQQRIMMLWDLLGQASLASQSTASAVDVRCGALEARSSKVSWRISSLRRLEKRSFFNGIESCHESCLQVDSKKKNIEFSVPRHPMR